MENKNTSVIRPQLKILSDDHREKLHHASCRILEQTGVNVHSPDLRSALKTAGAKIDPDGTHVFIPPKLVENALKTAPSRIDIYNRSGQLAMILEGTNSYYGTGSDLEFTIDHKTKQRRQSTLNDVEQAARLCDKLENIDFVMSFALPNDVPPEQTEILQMKTMFRATTKPVIMTVYSGLDVFEQVHKLACDTCSGPDAFREKPNYITYGQFVSPLQHDADALDRLIFCADHAVPVIYVPTIMMGASGPVSLAGALALANAECLAGLVMHQLRAPGAPFIYGGCVSPLDMKTTVFSYGSPEWRLADLALAEMSLHYNLPIFATAGAADSKTIDAQAGAEWAYSLLTCTLAGSNIIHDVAYLESGMAGSLESLVICNEIIGMVKRVLAGMTFDDAELALDTIQNVGPAGNFMEQDHTLARYKKDIWYPTLFNRDRCDNWLEQGAKTILQSAADRTDQLLK